MNFDHFTPTRILYGRGRLAELCAVSRPYGRRALLVCGSGAMRRLGVLQRITDILHDAPIELLVYDKISPNPRSDEIDVGLALVREHQIDFVIGLGGGSAIDAAKAIAVGGPYRSIAEIIGKTLPSRDTSLPLIAIPTTAGTGSEVSKGAIVLDVARQFKSGIRGDDLFPKVAIIDPDLMDTMPRHVAIETGFDALTHAIESYAARAATPLTRALSIAAVGKLLTALPLLAQGRAEPALRDEIAIAALTGGMNVATAGTCLPHRLQQAMGSLSRVQLSHGRGLAVVYPAWLRMAQGAAPDLFARLGAAVGVSDLGAEVGGLLQQLGMATRLREHGYEASDLDHFLKNISGNLGNDPIPSIDERTIHTLFAESW